MQSVDILKQVGEDPTLNNITRPLISSQFVDIQIVLNTLAYFIIEYY